MKKSCKEITDMLIDYADGQLSPGESSEVAEHLAKCEHCRSLLDGLRKSLELAGVIWTDVLAQTKAIRIPISRKPGKLRWLRYAAIAASILLVLTTTVIWRALIRPAKKEISFVEIERNITDSGNAAQLLAAADLLAKYTDTKDIAKRQYHYVVKRYPGTPAAGEAKLRIK
ncbi:MAG: anti-sigma factor family protein [Planctomycetota bacterium]|jgi:predicted anti-sigma-YlaC factor YlaD